MSWNEWAGTIASVATAIGVLIAAWQLWEARRQGRTEFEDGLAREYREIAQRIPVDALLGGELDEKTFAASLNDFYSYVDLSNEQVFLRMNRRVSKQTWDNWANGIRANLARAAFRRAWEHIKARAPDNFEELKRLEKQTFRGDPAQW